MHKSRLAPPRTAPPRLGQMSINEHALALLRTLVLHVATGSQLTEGEKAAVRTMAVLLGAKIDTVESPMRLDAKDAERRPVACNGEAELDLAQIGATLWLISHLMRLGGPVDKRRRRLVRALVDYFDGRRAALGLSLDHPVLYHYLQQVPSLRERSDYLADGWLPQQLLRTAPDVEEMGLDRLFGTSAARLTVYKLCYWFAAAGGRRNAAVIDALHQIRTELQLNRDEKCTAISAALAERLGTAPQPFKDPAKSQPLSLAIATRIIAGTLGGPDAAPGEETAAERIVTMIAEPDRLPALALVFDVVMRETRLSAASLAGIARLVEAIDPSEGELTSLLMRHELDTGRRIRLPRAYTLDYGKAQTNVRRVRFG